MNLEERIEKIHGLRGLVPPKVGWALTRYAQEAVGPIVELGAFRGQSTAYLAAGARWVGGETVHAFDAWDLPGNLPGKRDRFIEPDGQEEFERQLRSVGLWSQVKATKAFTTDAAKDWSGPVGLLFIDADHHYESVKADFEAWRPHLMPDATVLFDDWGTPKNPGVKQFTDELGRYEVEAERLAVVRRG